MVDDPAAAGMRETRASMPRVVATGTTWSTCRVTASPSLSATLSAMALEAACVMGQLRSALSAVLLPPSGNTDDTALAG